MVTVKLYLRTLNSTVHTGYVWVVFYVNREKVHFSTKVECDRKQWSEQNQRVKKLDLNASDKNLILENVLARINTVFVKYRLRNRSLSRAGFIKSYNRPDDFENFFAFCEDYKKIVSKRVENVTMAIHKTVLEKLKVFSPDLHFDDLTTEFICDFYAHLRKKVKNNENTAYKNMSVVRKYVRAAVKAGYIDENPFDDFSIIRTKPNYIYLEEEELQLIIEEYKKGLLDPNRYKTLQVFLFMCFGSQHIGDAKKMKLEQFNETSFTYYRLKLRNKKPELVTVPLSDAMKGILKDIVGNRKQGLIFDSLPADQTMNKYLKEIATMANVNKQISHKTGRHTFATFYLDKTTDLNSLKDIMGHSDIRETLMYAHVLEKSKQRGISCFDSFNM